MLFTHKEVATRTVDLPDCCLVKYVLWHLYEANRSLSGFEEVVVFAEGAWR
jgi:hypothetical protein